jgi:hypothetical protein
MINARFYQLNLISSTALSMADTNEGRMTLCTNLEMKNTEGAFINLPTANWI